MKLNFGGFKGINENDFNGVNNVLIIDDFISTGNYISLAVENIKINCDPKFYIVVAYMSKGSSINEYLKGVDYEIFFSQMIFPLSEYIDEDIIGNPFEIEDIDMCLIYFDYSVGGNASSVPGIYLKGLTDNGEYGSILENLPDRSGIERYHRKIKL